VVDVGFAAGVLGGLLDKQACLRNTEISTTASYLRLLWQFATIHIRDYFELVKIRPAKSFGILFATGPKLPFAYIHRVEVGLVARLSAVPYGSSRREANRYLFFLSPPSEMASEVYYAVQAFGPHRQHESFRKSVQILSEPRRTSGGAGGEQEDELRYNAK